MLPKPLCLSL